MADGLLPRTRITRSIKTNSEISVCRTGSQRPVQAVLFMGRDPVELAERAKYKPPAMRVRGVCYTKKSPFRYNEVVQANI